MVLSGNVNGRKDVFISITRERVKRLRVEAGVSLIIRRITADYVQSV